MARANRDRAVPCLTATRLLHAVMPTRSRRHTRRLGTRLRRLSKIASVMTRRTAAATWMGVTARLGRQKGGTALPRQVRLALEELGPTYIKLGQLLATRSDVISSGLQRELSTLRDHAPSIPYNEVQAQLERSLGASAAGLFTRFEIAPIACASIGQVHRATLEDGHRVAVKVRRPGICEEIEADLALIGDVARLAQRLSRRLRAYDLVGLLDEFGSMLRAETNYATEADNIAAIRLDFADDDTVTIPNVLTELSDDSVLVMDWVDGIPLSDGEQLDQAGTDRAEVARAIAHAYATMIFRSDRFHADPHPGNLIALAGGRLGLVDFGEVGTVTPTTRAALMQLLMALLSRDNTGLADAVLAFSRATRPVDRPELGAQLASLVGPITDSTMNNIKLSRVLRDLLHVLRGRGLLLPTDLAVLLKTVIECESTTDEIDPTLEMRSFLSELGTVAPTRRDT